MGTNYYARKKNYVSCPNCDCKIEIGYDELHIGKSSAGWAFSLRVYERQGEVGPRSLEEWKEYLGKKDVSIFDEYGRKVPLRILLESILSGKNFKRIPDREAKPGNGSYDLVPYEFS